MVQPSHAPRPVTNHRYRSSLPSKTLSCNGCSVMNSSGGQICAAADTMATMTVRTGVKGLWDI